MDNKDFDYKSRFHDMTDLYEFLRNIGIEIDTFEIVDFDYEKSELTVKKFDEGPHKIPTNIILKVKWKKDKNEILVKETDENIIVTPMDSELNTEELELTKTTTRNMQRFTNYVIQNGGLNVYQAKIHQEMTESEIETAEKYITEYKDLFDFIKLVENCPVTITRYEIPENYKITDGTVNLKRADSYFVKSISKKM